MSLFSCGSDDDSSDDDTVVIDDDTTTDDDDTSSDGTGIDISDVVMEYYKTDNGVTVEVDEDTETITITSTSLPDHKTPYWDVYGMEDEMYVDFPTYIVSDETYQYFVDDGIGNLEELTSYDEDGNTLLTFNANVNDAMAELEFIMEIPMFPEEAEEKVATELNQIGMALNGVGIFNNLINTDGTEVQPNALITLDESGGHPVGLSYHYHFASNQGIYTEVDDCSSTYPTCDDSNLVGFLRDGFPMYGRQEPDGSYPDDLDEYGGHVGETDEFDEDIYHYHTDSSDGFYGMEWYIMKSGDYYGTPGDYSVEVVQ